MIDVEMLVTADCFYHIST